MPPYEVYLVARLIISRQPGQAIEQEIRYLHGTRDTKEEAEELCEALNDRIADSEYRVVEVE